jgi:hypothetical protein
MSETASTRESVHERLVAARAALLDSIAGLSEAELQTLNVTPEWSIADMLRHVLDWNELVVRCLDDWHGPRDWVPTLARDDEDTFNIQQVAARAHADPATIRAGLEAAHRRFLATLEHSSDAELAERSEAPWGAYIPRLAIIDDMAGHDEEHAAQIAAARSGV